MLILVLFIIFTYTFPPLFNKPNTGILYASSSASFSFSFASEESSRGRTGDANLHELSDMVVTLIDDNRLVLFCSTHHLLAATLAEVLDEDGELLAFILLVLLGTHLGLQFDKFVEAGYLGFLRNVIWQMLGGIGARAL